MTWRMIQVGLGSFGRRWMRVMLSDPRWAYAGLVSRNQQVLSQCAEGCGLGSEGLYADLQTALESLPDADAVLITTPYFLHTEQILLALRAGKHVLVEKPLCETYADALAIRDAVRASGRTLMVSENYRFSAAALAVHNLIQSGEIGTPEFICIQYFVQHRFPADDWRNNLKYPLLIENSTHHYDLLRYVTGQEAQSLNALTVGSESMAGNVKPSVSVQIQMQGGLIVSYCGSWAYAPFRTPWEGNWWIRGSQGAIYWQGDQITLAKDGIETRVELPPGPADTLGGVLDEFSTALEQRRAPSVDIEDNLRTVAMMTASIQSAETGSPVHLDT